MAEAQTLTEQIFSRALGRRVSEGELVVVRPDIIMGHDSLTPSIIKIMRQELAVEHVHDPDQIALVIDHVAPASNLATAAAQQIVRGFARAEGIEKFFDVGNGICHQVLLEYQYVRPGMIVIGSDSHSTGFGAAGAFGTGMGSTDIALAMATGRTWMRVPETARIWARGRFLPGVGAKDLALKIGKEIGIAGASYAAVEYRGLDWLRMDQRQTLTSMAVELGAKAGIVPPSLESQAATGIAPPEWMDFEPAAPARFEMEIDLGSLAPQLALPHAVDQVVDIDEKVGENVDVVFLGTCTNGRYEDLRRAAGILRGRLVSPDTRLIVTPASRMELERATRDETLLTLIEAGAVLTTPGCGPCMGRHQGTLADDEVCLSTGNRNFKGRMGSARSSIYLASPEVAAASAIAGRIADPRSIKRR